MSRNTYIRAGIAEWKITNPVHIVKSLSFLLYLHLVQTHLMNSIFFLAGMLLPLHKILPFWQVSLQGLYTSIQVDRYINVIYFDKLHCFFFVWLLQNSSQKLKDVAKYMNFKSSKADGLYRGTYTLSMTDDKVSCLLTVYWIGISTALILPSPENMLIFFGRSKQLFCIQGRSLLS